jgi:hypothetical protein
MATQVIEQTGKTYPKVYSKPLSREDSIEIEAVKTRFTSADATPLETTEDETTVTLHVPELIRYVRHTKAAS